MTDELIERIGAAIKSDDMPDFDYVQDMEARILADAEALKAADELARRVQQQQDGWPMRQDYIETALAAYRKARGTA